jgi:hypothetical protein
MKILIVTQKNNSTGQKKVWKLRPVTGIWSLGLARRADLQSIDQSLDAFQASIEYRDSRWLYFQFGVNADLCCRHLNESDCIEFKNSELQFKIDDRQESRSLQLLRIKSGLSKYSTYDVSELLSKSIHFSWQSQNVRLGFGLVASFALTLLISFALAEKKEVATRSEVILSGQKVFIQKSQKRKISSSKNISATKAQNLKKEQLSGKFIGSRLTQLMGKISRQGSGTLNRTGQIFKGSAAQPGGTGRLLAALEKGKFSGQIWAQQGGDAESGRIHTAGRGGGGSDAALGTTLAQGTTGSGGVALIEEESEVSGGLDREIIAQYIKTKLGQILYCYERQLSATPDIFGKVNVRFTIAGSGQVESQTVNDSTLRSRPVENCVLGKISGWRFPEPKGGIKVVVTYPFIFKSTN